MKTKIIKTITIISAIIGLTFTPITAFAECSSEVCSNPDKYPASVRSACGCSGTAAEAELPDVIANIISAITVTLGIVALVFIFVGGISYMTSSGDSSKVKKAKDTILYACIGLAVCALAFAITQFAINTINGATSAPADGDSDTPAKIKEDKEHLTE